MGDYFIPISVQSDLQDRVDDFQKKNLPKVSWRFIADARGKFIYLRRYMSDDTCHNLGRMTYKDDIENMAFAIFRYNTEKYDEASDFLGSAHLNGTIEGALRALLIAYP